MGAQLYDAPQVEDGNAVRGLRSLEAVRDDHGRATMGDALHGRCDPGLGGEVEVRGGLVQEQDGRVDELGPGESYELALARRK